MKFTISALLTTLALSTPILSAPTSDSALTPVTGLLGGKSAVTDILKIVGNLETGITTPVDSLGKPAFTPVSKVQFTNRILPVSGVTGDVTDVIVPQVETALHAIGVTLTTTTSGLLTTILPPVLALTIGEVEAVLCLVDSVAEIVLEVVALVEFILANVVGDALELVLGEVEVVLQLLAPVLNPVVKFAVEAVGVVGTVESDVTNKVCGIGGLVEDVLAKVVLPVDEAVKEIVGSNVIENLKLAKA
jgi:hypothetical protein